LILLSCDRDFLNERRFPLVKRPAIFVLDLGSGSDHDIRQTFRCLSTAFRVPQFFDQWWKIDAKPEGWTEYVRHLGRLHGPDIDSGEGANRSGTD